MPTAGLFAPPGKTPLRVVDIPGHERVRAKFLEHEKRSSLAIVYVVDSSTLQKQLRDAAEFLFNILSDPVVNANKVPVLIACNKQVRRDG